MLGALSFATDMAAGVPMETSLRTAVVAARLARDLRLGDDDVANVYYTALLRHLGCTSFAHEAADFAGGDDQGLLRTFEAIDLVRRTALSVQAVRRLASHAPLPARAAAVAKALATPSLPSRLARAQCDQAVALASDLAMGDATTRALQQMYERYDGRGHPGRLTGPSIELGARISHVANVVEILHRHGGRARATDEVRARRGGHLDPDVAAAFLADADAYWAALEAPSVWEAYLEAEPAPAHVVDKDRLDVVALSFGRYADLKSPWRLGHSRAVADLAATVAGAVGLPPREVETLRRAALLHDIGIVCVANGVLDKRGPLNPAEWERVRLHAYYGERILARVPALAPAGLLAGAHHERCDGTGYPHQASGGIARAARILACADVYTALGEARPHRPPLPPRDAARVLREEARAGRLCKQSVEETLEAAGHTEVRRTPADDPKGTLTAREKQVLVHLARGLTNKEVGTTLAISPRTVQHHVEHIYAKLGISTRAAAALFAIRHDMVGRSDDDQ
jgi:HD-GYP domain-containing protein (c-di-GMP phosphodiesterase class II)